MAASEKRISPGAKEETKSRSLLADLVVRLVREKPLSTAGGVIVLIFIIVAIFANFIAPFRIDEMSLLDRFMGPSAAHWLGTDNLGRDMLSRIVFGARISVYVGFGAAILALIVSTLVGGISGFLGGKTDTIIQRFVDVFMCFPWLVIALTIMSVLGQGMVQVILVLGILGGIGGSRMPRSAVIGIKENTYFGAAVAIGAPKGTIFIRHVLPNIMPVLIITFTTSIGGMILSEASLSFLGYGIPPDVPSWGGMLSGSGREHMLRAPWMALWPGVALALVVYGMNMLGDGVRDILDPRLRGGLGRYSGVKAKMPKKESKA